MKKKRLNKVPFFKFLMIVLLAGTFFLSQSKITYAKAIKYAQAGMPFLKIDVSPRSAAMGGTQMGSLGEAMNMFTNPAGIALVNGLDVSSAVNNWIAGIKHYGGGVAYNLGNAGTFGVNFVWMDYGTFTRTVPVVDPNASDALRNQGYVTDGTFSVTEGAIGISYGRQISSQFSVGGQLKYAMQNLPDVDIYDEFSGEVINATNSLNNIALDFGTLFYPGFKDLRFGMSIRNFANQADYYDQRFELPLTFDFGLAMNLFELFPDASFSNSGMLTAAFDWVHPRDYGERQHFGLEYSYQDVLFLRGGYRANYSQEGLTAGFGFNLNLGGNIVKANYAYSAFGEFFGSVHRISLGFAID